MLETDRTLLLSNYAHADAWTKTLVEGGVTMTADRVRPLVGMNSDELPALAAHDDSLLGRGLRAAAAE